MRFVGYRAHTAHSIAPLANHIYVSIIALRAEVTEAVNMYCAPNNSMSMSMSMSMSVGMLALPQCTRI